MANVDPTGNASVAGAQAPNIHDMLTGAHDSAQALFQHTSMLTKRMEGVGQELDKLVKLGDTVTPEDVIEGVGTLVAKGSDPMQMAGVLADMPAGGAALSAWVKQHAQQQAMVTQQFAQQHALAQHELGVSALRSLAGHHGELPGAMAHPAFAAPAPPAPGGDPAPMPATDNPLGASAPGSIH